MPYLTWHQERQPDPLENNSIVRSATDSSGVMSASNLVILEKWTKLCELPKFALALGARIA